MLSKVGQDFYPSKVQKRSKIFPEDCSLCTDAYCAPAVRLLRVPVFDYLRKCPISLENYTSVLMRVVYISGSLTQGFRLNQYASIVMTLITYCLSYHYAPIICPLTSTYFYVPCLPHIITPKIDFINITRYCYRMRPRESWMFRK